MFHSVIFRSMFVLVSVQLVTCQDRITINEFLSLVDKITLLFEDTRHSIPSPNNLKPFKVRHIYETSDVRSQFDTLPQSVKDLLKIFYESHTSTTTFVSTSELSSGTTSTSSATESPTSHKTTSSTELSEETTTETPSSTKFTETPTNIESTNVPTSSTLSPSSGETTSSTVSTSVSDSSATMDTTESSSSSMTSTLETSTTMLRNGIYLDQDNTKDKNNRKTAEFATMNNREEDDTLPVFSNLRSLGNLTDDDKDKATEVVNDLTALATLWSPAVSLYKGKLRLFQSYLSEKYPSTFFEKIKAKILAKGPMVANPILRVQITQIMTKADSYRAKMEDPAIMNRLMALAHATGELPNLLIKSLRG